MIFTRRFGALAARRTFPDAAPEVTVEQDPRIDDAQLQREIEEAREDAVA
jgi:hypothetical protein